MKKHEFLAKLERELVNLSDRDEIIAYYEELINDALGNGEDEITFIKHLGTPAEIKHKLTRDDEFKANIKAKKNFSATQTFTTVTKILSNIVYFIAAFFVFIFGLGLVTSGVFAITATIYKLVLGGMSVNVVFYYIFYMVMNVSLIIFGVLCFVYIFKYSKKQLEKLQLTFADKLQKGESQ